MKRYKERGNLNDLEIITDFESNVYSPITDAIVEEFQKALENIPKSNQKFSEVSVQRWIRDKNLARILKSYYQDICQLCKTRLQTVNGYISEAHHIQPYNNTHKGEDTIQNMIVLCPNCHSRFDDLYYVISPDSLIVHCYSQDDPLHLTPIQLKVRHRLENKYLEYMWNLFLEQKGERS